MDELYDRRRSDNVMYTLGTLSSKLDDIHEMVHKNHSDFSAIIAELKATDAKQSVHISSLLNWRSRVRGIASVVIALPAVIWGGIKVLGIKVGLQ